MQGINYAKNLPTNYTNYQWQQDFQELKNEIKPSRFKYMSVGAINTLPHQRYKGKTQYQCYCDFINGILKSIRAGQKDYCFYVYHVEDLLKYEHDRLNVVWLDNEKCFCVSLNQFGKIGKEVKL